MVAWKEVDSLSLVVVGVLLLLLLLTTMVLSITSVNEKPSVLLQHVISINNISTGSRRYIGYLLCRDKLVPGFMVFTWILR